MSAPLHTATINGQEVRFFRSPLPGEDLPWHAVDDLTRAMGLPRVVRRDMEARTRTHWPELCSVVTVDNQKLLIACHAAGQGLTGAYDQTQGHAEDGPLFIAYCRAAREANDVLLEQDGLTPMEGLSRTLRAVARGQAGHVH